MKELKAIRIKSDTTPDLNGYYEKTEIETELKELGLESTDWLGYLLDHLFMDVDGWSGNVQAMVASECVTEIKLHLEGNVVVRVTKYY